MPAEMCLLHWLVASMKKLKPLQLLIGSIPLHKKVILQVHSDSCFINMIFKHNNPEVHLWDSILSFH